MLCITHFLRVDISYDRTSCMGWTDILTVHKQTSSQRLLHVLPTLLKPKTPKLSVSGNVHDCTIQTYPYGLYTNRFLRPGRGERAGYESRGMIHGKGARELLLLQLPRWFCRPATRLLLSDLHILELGDEVRDADGGVKLVGVGVGPLLLQLSDRPASFCITSPQAHILRGAIVCRTKYCY